MPTCAMQLSACPSGARLASGRRLQHTAFVSSLSPSNDRLAHVSRKRQHLQICAAKGKGKTGMRQGTGPQQQRPQLPTPDVDPENVEFVLFVSNPKLPQWIPVSIVKGSRPTNLLVGLLESEWGKKLFGKTLVRSIAQPVWKDRKKIEPKLKSQAAPLKFASELQWAFKVRDKTKPKSWHEAVDLTILPEEGSLEPSLGEKVVDWFNSKRGKTKPSK